MEANITSFRGTPAWPLKSTASVSNTEPPLQTTTSSKFSFLGKTFVASEISPKHQELLKALEVAILKYTTPTSEKAAPSLVTQTILKHETIAANTAAQRATEASTEGLSVINRLNFQKPDPKQKAIISALTASLQTAATAAIKSSTMVLQHEKKIAQLCVKMTILHAAEARLALAQLKDLEKAPGLHSHSSHVVSTSESTTLKEAKKEHAIAQQEIKKEFGLDIVDSDHETVIDSDSNEEKSTLSSVTSDEDALDVPAKDSNEEDENSESLANDSVWRDVSDEEAKLRYGNVDTSSMNNT